MSKSGNNYFENLECLKRDTMNRKQKNIRTKHIILILSVILFSYNSWRDLSKYYKSLIYISSFNTLYYLLCRRHLVWEFTPIGISWRIIRFVHIVVISPLLVLTFLSKFPNSLFKQVIYIVKWVLTASVVEYYANKHKLIMYKHGWNTFWTGLIYAKMFLYGYLFIKKPLHTLLLSFCSTIFFVQKFKVPMRQKHVSSKFERFVDMYYHTNLEDILYFIKKRVT